MTSRVGLLRALLALERPTPEITAELRAYGWDSDIELVRLRREHVRSVIERYLRGEIDSDTVEEWAESIEGREDIGYEAGWESELGSVLHQLANPLLSGQLSTSVGRSLLERL
jgi:hypothetical protein